MNAQDLLRRWAAAKLDMDPDTIMSVYFEHEDGYTNESGTYWPANTWAVVNTTLGLREIACATDVAELLEDILSCGG